MDGPGAGGSPCVRHVDVEGIGAPGAAGGAQHSRDGKVPHGPAASLGDGESFRDVKGVGRDIEDLPGAVVVRGPRDGDLLSVLQGSRQDTHRRECRLDPRVEGRVRGRHERARNIDDVAYRLPAIGPREQDELPVGQAGRELGAGHDDDLCARGIRGCHRGVVDGSQRDHVADGMVSAVARA